MSSEIKERLSPDYYCDASKSILTSIPVAYQASLVDAIEDMYRYPTFYGIDYSNEGIPVIKGESIDENGIINTNQQFDCITEQVHNKFSRTHLKEGDLVFTVRGKVGKVGLFHGFKNGANINANVIKIRIKPKALSKYVWYYFNLPIGQSASAQYSSGQVQQTITVPDIKSIPISIPPLAIQKKVVEIMDTAHATKKDKETEAKQVLASIDCYLLAELGITLPEIHPKTCFTTLASEVRDGRIDAMPYHPIRMTAVKAVQDSSLGKKSLSEIVSFNNKVITSNLTRLPYIGLEDIESATGLYKPVSQKESFGTANTFVKGNVLFPKLRPYLNKVFYADFDGCCSTEFHVFDPHGCESRYLKTFLSSVVVVRQTSYLMTGNTLPRLQTEDVRQLLIPLPARAIQERIANEVQKRMDKAQVLKREAIEGLDAAKRQAEAIILGA